MPVTPLEAYHSPPLQTDNEDLTPICILADPILKNSKQSRTAMSYP